MAAALRFVLGIEAEMQQGIVVLAGDHDDVAAASAIAAAGAAARHVLLAPKRQTAVAAVAGLHQNSYFIDEHGKEKPPICCLQIGGAFTSKRLLVTATDSVDC